MINEYYLTCEYDARKSFYKKAYVLEQNHTSWSEKDLYSYGTLVAKVLEAKKIKKYIYYGKYSQTTTRHQKEFFKQNGLNDEEIKELQKNNELVKEKKNNE